MYSEWADGLRKAISSLAGQQKLHIKVEKITNIIIKTQSKEGKTARPDNRSTESNETGPPTTHPLNISRLLATVA